MRARQAHEPDHCDLCGGELHPGTTTLEIWRDGELSVITDVPADVCCQCGEAYISAETSRRLDTFMSEPHRPQRCLAVPEYSVKQVA